MANGDNDQTDPEKDEFTVHSITQGFVDGIPNAVFFFIVMFLVGVFLQDITYCYWKTQGPENPIYANWSQDMFIREDFMTWDENNSRPIIEFARANKLSPKAYSGFGKQKHALICELKPVKALQDRQIL